MTLSLNEYLDTPIQEVGAKRYARNIPARHLNPHCKIALIGEAPGAEELSTGTPFVGQSGRLLDGLLSKAGILRDYCFIGNICETRPDTLPDGSFPLEGQDIEEGLRSLAQGLETYQPNICLLLGVSALYQALGETKIGNWRGSYFIGKRPGPFWGRKCIASYNPAACLKNYEWTSVLLFDICKAKRQAHTPEWTPPQRDLVIPSSVADTLTRLEAIVATKAKTTIDIEGYVDAMTCCSFATAPDHAFVVDFTTPMTLNEECQIWRAVSNILEDPTIPKVVQNVLYDSFVFQWSYSIIIQGIVDDTMVKHWEKWCELEKKLGFLNSIYTDEPYYKEERKSDDWPTHLRYCCRDSATTHEINDKLERSLEPSQLQHYRFNVELLNVFRYMQHHGLLYDSAEALRRRNEVAQHISALQFELDKVTGYGIKPETTRGDLLATVQSVMCYKRDVGKIKAAFTTIYPDIYKRLLDPTPLDATLLGYVSTQCDLSFNIKSKQFKTYLYDTLKLPTQYDSKTGAITTDYEALLVLVKKTSHPVVKLALEQGLLRTRYQMLGICTDADSRIRCGYNLVGADTGRITCYTSNTGSGYNLQTLPDADVLKPASSPLSKGMRDLVLADPGYYLIKCDLKGADGWTVGANLKALGDPTMFDDLVFGIKPAQVGAYMVRHGHSSVAGKSRQDLKEMLKEVKKSDWDYFAWKQLIWGFCYSLGPRKAAATLLQASEGTLDLSENDMREWKRLILLRYNVRLWHDALTRKLSQKPEITTASGHKRRFFGRYNEILGQALAHEPQANTTYATNKAAWRLWQDPENRILGENSMGVCGILQQGTRQAQSRVSLRVKPIHQVHDELLTTCLITDVDWAKEKIKQWFQNPMTIAGITLTIPFEGQYGTNWAMDELSKKGEF